MALSYYVFPQIYALAFNNLLEEMDAPRKALSTNRSIFLKVIKLIIICEATRFEDFQPMATKQSFFCDSAGASSI